MPRADILVERFTTMNNAITEIAENATDEQWAMVVEGENWPVGFVLNHIVAGHYSVIGLIKRVVRGQPLPDLSNQNTDAENEQMLAESANIGRNEVLAITRKNGEKIASFMSTLTDEQLTEVHHWSLWGQDWSIERMFKIVILHSAGGHLANVQATLGES